MRQCNLSVEACDDVGVAVGHLFACGATSVRIARLAPDQERRVRYMVLPYEIQVELTPPGGATFYIRGAAPWAPPPPPPPHSCGSDLAFGLA